MADPLAGAGLALRLLEDQGPELRGLELVKLSGGKLKRVTVYVLLARMEDEGLIASRRQGAANERGYRHFAYRATGNGRRIAAQRFPIPAGAPA